jgi:D-alanyl-D-alanine carboxypeptidase
MRSIEKLMDLLIRNSESAPIHNCILYINSPKNNINYKAAFGKMNESGGNLNHNYCFRTGSITKTFTATIIMQLMEEDVLNLDDLFLDCLNENTRKFFEELILFEGVNYSNKITIKDLLQHRSGLRDYFSDDDRFLNYVMEFPFQNWGWKTVMEKYFEYNLNEKGSFKIGKDFYYSDTNYLLLAILIEDLISIPFHEVLEERIFTPLSLNNTYLEFHQEAKSSTPIVFPFYKSNDLKNINSSFDWGGGGLISSANDLDVFIRSLLSGQLFKRGETLKLMTSFDDNHWIDSASKKERTVYGIGLQKKKIGNYNFIGHHSAYGGMMFYDLNSDCSIIFSINQMSAQHKAEWLIKKIVEDLVS